MSQYVNYVRFKDWSEIGPIFHKYQFKYILISWDTLSNVHRPNPANRWSGTFPVSVMQCLDHVYYGAHDTDIFEIKPECL